MRVSHDLSTLDWTLTGWAPYLWRASVSMELGLSTTADHVVASAPVPGSVQLALRQADILPDWTQAETAQACEWVENRHWLYETRIPDEWLADDAAIRLRCLGLDYSGWVLLNGEEVGEFCGTNVPHVFDLSGRRDSGNRLTIAFDLPPRWLGQFGYTSKITEWKTRFNYTWDWQPRLVQLGIWDDITIEVVDGGELTDVRCTSDADPEAGIGSLHVAGEVVGDGAVVTVSLRDGRRVLRSATVSSAEFAAGLDWDGLDVELWWPNGQGAQPLYDVVIALVDEEGVEHDRAERRIGFRNIVWRQCVGASATSDTWLCVVNGRPVFLQGVNFPPMAGNFADVTREQYRRRLELYRELGVNTFRINACGYLEKKDFYEICDELGLLVWQDLPITSSLLENVPPSDPDSIEAMSEIFRSFIARRRHHASLLMWSGGNEQFQVETAGDGTKTMIPIGTEHPMMARLSQIARELDPARRFIPASPTGPRFVYNPADAGKGLHENVHGPYGGKEGMAKWRAYWESQDALFRAELASSAASNADVVERYAGGLDPLPVSATNPVWRRPSPWWVETEIFVEERGREPESLAEYVDWSQARQSESLSIAVAACKDGFPRNGGVLLWCGHDSYPNATNCSIIDYENTPKPAALALKEIWRRDFRA